MKTDRCTDACYAMPFCATCRMRKAPRGRDIPAEAANGYCGRDCAGYDAEPRSGHLWPSEQNDFEHDGHQT